MHRCVRLLTLLRERGLDRVLAEIFLPGRPMQDIVGFVKQHARPRAGTQ